MDRNSILEEVIDFAHKINDSLSNKESIKFNVGLKAYINSSLSNNYNFLYDLIDICHRKKIQIPKAIGDFLLYDEDLRKDVIYTFLLNSNIKPKHKDSV